MPSTSNPRWTGDRTSEIGIVVYGAVNRKDWRRISVDDLKFDPGEIENQLFPLLTREFTAK